VGSGLQWFGWIHMLDAVRAILFPLTSPSSPLEGAYNVVAPNVVRLRDFCVELGTVMNRWSWAHVPWFAARILLGEVANTVVTGQRLAPKRLLDGGFDFKYSDLNLALKDVVGPSSATST
jgi:NAD dependent epimerase/dehydratase family enzyme